jgi:hypothetical protein
VASPHIVDANVLLEAANVYYTFKRVPGFWSWMEQSINAGSIRSVSLIQAEVEHPQELVDWLDDRLADGIFIDVSAPGIQAEYRKLVNWLVARPFGPEHIAKFLNGADPWIIASAKVMGATVCTQEQLIGPGSRKIKIPNVCREWGVDYCNTFEMLDALGAAFLG